MYFSVKSQQLKMSEADSQALEIDYRLSNITSQRLTQINRLKDRTDDEELIDTLILIKDMEQNLS